MNYTEALKKLEKYGQTHLLKYYDGLDGKEKADLLRQIDEIDFSVVNTDKSAGEKGKIEPITVTGLDEIKANYDRFYNAGMEKIKSGSVGAVLLAGGMGTRLGSNGPKGMFNIGITHEVFIFERLIKNLIEVTDAAGKYIHLFIMTSDKNNDATVNFLNEKNFFGYAPEYVHFFKQEQAPAADRNGKVYLEERGKIATSPNGNGGWYSSMAKCGLLDTVRENGIKYLNVFAVDNVLQRIADPVFIGAAVLNKSAVGSKVIKKASPDERVGVMCLENGRPSVVEYYELTDEMRNAVNEKGEPAYNYGVILNYLFETDKLDKIAGAKLPLHTVEKKIPHIDENGIRIEPEKPNGYKYETLILDMIRMLDGCTAFEVEREKEFAPVKNRTGTDSVETARALLIKNGVKL